MLLNDVTVKQPGISVDPLHIITPQTNTNMYPPNSSDLEPKFFCRVPPCVTALISTSFSIALIVIVKPREIPSYILWSMSQHITDKELSLPVPSGPEKQLQ